MSGIYDTKYGHAIAVTPSDTVLQAYEGIYIGGAGNLTVIMESGQSALFTAPPVGTLLPIRVKQVMATGTTATAIVGLR